MRYFSGCHLLGSKGPWGNKYSMINDTPVLEECTNFLLNGCLLVGVRKVNLSSSGVKLCFCSIVGFGICGQGWVCCGHDGWGGLELHYCPINIS